MTPERAKALEMVAEAARAWNHAYSRTVRGAGKDHREALSVAVNALDALPAEPADAGEMVEVRACVALQPDGRWNWIGFGNARAPENDETLAEYALDFGAGNAKVVAFTTARVPLPTIPTIAARVEG